MGCGCTPTPNVSLPSRHDNSRTPHLMLALSNVGHGLPGFVGHAIKKANTSGENVKLQKRHCIE